jgi:hypothetical protein
MAKLYISYNHRDTDLALKITQGLRKLGHIISIDIESVSAGEDWRKKLNKELTSADGIVVLVSENSLSSQYVASEIGTARTLTETQRNKFLIPVIIGDIEIPQILQDILCLRASNSNEIIQKVDNTITKLIAIREEETRAKEETRERIELSANKYVQDVLKALDIREKKNKRIGLVWYIVGFIALLAGVSFGIIGFWSVSSLTTVEITKVILISLKSIIIIGLLIALSKYSFTLGKSYTNESLKNADRIHAISFGDFYLKAFSDRVNFAELKEVFQHWNINNDSFFSKLNTKDFDPKILENLIELTKAFSSKGMKEK